MKNILHLVKRLFHPITLAVFLVGVGGFLFGLIFAVERQDATIVAPRVDTATSRVDTVAPTVDTEASNRIAQLEGALAARETELAELQGQLSQLRAEAPSPAAMVDANNKIASLEVALANSTAELDTLQRELDKLSGQLAEAIQARDAVREQSDRERRDTENERASLQQSIADLTARLAAAEEAVREQAETAARAQAEAAAGKEPSPPTEAAAEPEQAAADSEASAPQPAASASNAPDTAEADAQTQQAAAPAPTGGPIAQGIAAYRATNYREAYELWLPEARKGSARAQFYVGALYFEGRGVPTDRVASYMWLRAATQANDPGAIKLLDRLREGMSGPELAEAETRIANGETIPAQ